MLTGLTWIYASALVLAYLLFSLWCYRKPLKHWWNPPMLAEASTVVAFASESGHAQTLALNLFTQLQKQNEAVECLALNNLPIEKLSSISRLLLVVSTYGEGEAPDNARIFERKLINYLKKSADLSHLTIATLALGDSHYAQFCGFGIRLHQMLLRAEACELFAPVLVDALQPESVSIWQSQLHEAAVIDEPLASVAMPAQSLHELTLLNRTLLNEQSPGAPMFALEFSAAAATWQAGDILNVHIQNQIREYSIASIPTEGVVRLLVREQKNEQNELGLGSGFLCHVLTLGEKASFTVRSNPAFHAPESATPVIFIGNGTGLAGLRAHLKARETSNTQNWLILGERSPIFDKPHHDELLDWADTEHLTRVDFTYSRASAEDLSEQNSKVVPNVNYHTGYVQHVLYSQEAVVRDWINRGAAIYVCGSLAGMASDVDNALCAILGQDTLDDLIAQNRYRRDVY